jgi:hypothetical protein
MDVAAWLRDPGLGQYGVGFARTKSMLMFCRSERDCRPYEVDRDRSGPIRIEHGKTGAIIDYPLEADGVKFYADAEEVLAKLPARYQWSFASLRERQAVRVQLHATYRSAHA